MAASAKLELERAEIYPIFGVSVDRSWLLLSLA